MVVNHTQITIAISPTHQCTRTERKMEGEGIKKEKREAKKAE
jgi:hypothetical protein